MDNLQNNETTPQQEQDLNLLVEWEDDSPDLAAPEKAGEDDVLTFTSAETLPADEESLSGVNIIRETEGISISGINAQAALDRLNTDSTEAMPVMPDEDEFAWSDELDRAIDEALEQMSGISAPVVYSRLKRIIALFEAHEMTGDRALYLIDEVAEYLEKQIRIRTNLPPINHEGMQKARSLIQDALHAFSESCKSMKNYIQTGAPEDKILAENLSEHGISFALEGVEEMLAAEPGEYEVG